MSYTPPVYPSTIPSQTGTGADLPDRIDDIDWLYAARYNELKKEIIAIMTELGTLPKGSSADVKTRLGTLTPNPMSAPGDMIKGGTSGIAERLIAGGANLKLFMNNAANSPEFANGIKVFTNGWNISLETDQIITSIGFKPSALIIFAAVDATLYASWGVSDSTLANYCIASNREGNAGTYCVVSDKICQIYTAAGTAAKCFVKSYDNDGFTLTWTKTGTPSGSAQIMGIAFR